MPRNKFKHFPSRPERLTAAFAKKYYESLAARVPEAESANNPDKWIRLYGDWNEFGSYLSSEWSRTYYAYHRNMASPKLKSRERYFREKIWPPLIEPAHTLIEAFLVSRHRDVLAQRFGKQLVPSYETQVKPLDPVNTQLGVKAGKLTAAYDELIAGATVDIRGEKMTLWKARTLSESPDEELRKESYLAVRDWVLKNRSKTARIYSQLVGLRQQMAKNVGYDNFIPLAYLSMGRTDYGPEQVAEFRQNVLKYVVPIVRKLAVRQAEALGKSRLRPWDFYDPRTSLPLGIVPVKNQLAQAQRLFDKLSPELGGYFKYMRNHGLIDLENRRNKRSGAYCTDFSDEGKPAILLNSTGDADDVRTLTHEMGHAFQGWESAGIEAVDLQWGTMDLAEVLSTGMEFLSLPYITEFFKPEHAKKFRVGRWEQAVGLLCYVCVVDEFQHWVYLNPGVAPAERDNKWTELSDKYLADVDYSGYEKYMGTRWYLQGHIFSSPFYYIDYALAETGSMQLAMMAEKNHDKAVGTYLKLCRIGGTMSFLEAFDFVGLRSPFDAGAIKGLAAFAAKQLGV